MAKAPVAGCFSRKQNERPTLLGLTSRFLLPVLQPFVLRNCLILKLVKKLSFFIARSASSFV